MGDFNPDASNVNILALLFLMAMCFVIFQSSRQNAVRAVLGTAALVPLGQQIVVGGLHLHFLRILILAGLTRLVTRREYDGFKLATIDKLFLAWVFVGFVCGLSREPSAETFGQVYNDVGVYFLLRILMQKMDGPLGDFKFYAVLGIVIGACMLVEECTHRNPFYIFGGVPQLTVQRGDRFRCQGPFRQMILAGTFGATLFPLMIGLWRTRASSRLLAAIGIVCSFIITVASASSGPVLTLLAAFIGIGLWPMRKQMRFVRIGMVLILVGFSIFMNAPVWYIISKLSDLVGGGGWHRSYLIDQFVHHFNEWWLNGTSYTAHWAPDGEVLPVNPKMMDITNHYVEQGIQGGILRLGIFIAIIVNCFKIIGRAVREQFGPAYDPRVAWSLGVTLACHCTAFISVFYFDQTLVFWFWLLAAIASIPGQAAAYETDEDSMPAETSVDVDESVAEIATPLEGEDEKEGEESLPMHRVRALQNRPKMRHGQNLYNPGPAVQRLLMSFGAIMACWWFQPRIKTHPAARRNWPAALRKRLAVLLSVCLTAASGEASTWYVDSSASGANNGTSWANAWTSLNAVSGVKAGDVVYVSGGPAGSSRTYLMSGTWNPIGGTPGSPVTYQIAPDTAHNGTATFNGGGGNTWLGTANNVVVSGDAGDGSQHFATVGCSMAVSGTGSQNLRISYVNFGQMLFGILLNQASVFEVDHCYLYKIDGTAPGAHDYAFSLSQTTMSASSYDVNKIHDNIIYVPRGSYAFGDDCVQQTGNGLSMYNNTVVGYVTSYGGNQHQDGFQTLTGSYLKIYNNAFINMGNSGIFLDGYYGGFTNVLVYNNLVYMNSPIAAAYYPRGMDIISDSAAVPGPLTFANVIVANNTVANYPTLYGIGFYAPATGVGSTYTNDLVANNISYNTSGNDIDNRAGLANMDNNTVTGAGSNFVSYLSLDAAPSGFQYDFHLAASDTTFRLQGTNLYQYFTTDKDGTSRSSRAAWDLGAYAFGGSAGPNLPPTVSAISQNAVDVDPNASGVQVLEGTVVQYSASAADPNGDPLTWNWVYTVNGGPEITYQSGSGTVVPVNFTYATGTAGNTYLWTLRVSDGQLTSQSQVTTAVEVPPQAGQGLAFLATSGTIATPFATNNGYISQAVQTSAVTNGGRAAYNFTITNAGYYVVQALVNASTDAANSMYVNIDAEPQDPNMFWDVPLTAGFEQRLVSWRGTGTDTSDQYVPEFFLLTQGAHQIIFRGRQANVQLQGFNILKVPQPPNGLQMSAGP